MKINKTIVITVLLFGLLIGGLAAGVVFSQKSANVNAASLVQKDDDIDETNEVEDNDGNEANEIEDNDGDEANEVEEPVSTSEAIITAAEAKAAAEAAYPGTQAREVELERENGVTAYEVGLDNGLEVLVDPANGDILGEDADY